MELHLRLRRRKKEEGGKTIKGNQKTNVDPVIGGGGKGKYSVLLWGLRLVNLVEESQSLHKLICVPQKWSRHKGGVTRTSQTGLGQRLCERGGENLPV